MSAPEVTVLLPVYNGEKYLRESLASLLGQSYRAFELLVIDDGSTDASLDIIESVHDSRLKLVKNAGNQGLVYTLNRGLALAAGRFLMRMDADDIALPQRIERQLNFMRCHPTVGISGTWSRTFGAVEKPWETRFPVGHEDIVAHMLFHTALSHPTAMMDLAQMRSHHLAYDKQAQHAEDYDLWVRASACFHLANVPEVLLSYRTHSKQVSQQYHEIQRQTADAVRFNLLRRMGIECDQSEQALHSRLCAYDWPPGVAFYQAAIPWLRRIADDARTENNLLHTALKTSCRNKAIEVHRHTFRGRDGLGRLGLRWFF